MTIHGGAGKARAWQDHDHRRLYRQDPHAGSSLLRTTPAPHDATTTPSALPASSGGQHLSLPSHRIASQKSTGKNKAGGRKARENHRHHHHTPPPAAAHMPGRRSGRGSLPTTYDGPAIKAGLFRQNFPAFNSSAPPWAMRRTPYRRDDAGLPELNFDKEMLSDGGFLAQSCTDWCCW